MRFGKRPRTVRLFGRKADEPPAQTSTPESAAYEPVRHDEWNALVTPDDEPEWREDAGAPYALDDMGDEESMSGESGREATLDPTNRLLTALGRFHREVLKAREGSVHAQWPDVCVNQLINAVEIALAQGWGEVVEALGETGRILQSYTEGGRAGDSVEFLEDAYELLCLMVGDLIVGSVRPGVVEKWKERYARAVEDLEAAGLTLVDDDDGGALSGEPAAEPAAGTPESPESPIDELPALDTLAPLEDEVPVAETPESGETHGTEELLDTVSEALARIEADPAGQHPAAFATIADAVEELKDNARAQGRTVAAFASDVMLRVCEAAQQVEGALEDRFFELAYGFPGLYAEASDTSDDDSVDSWTMECETLLVSWSAAAESGSEPSQATAQPAEPVESVEAMPFDMAALDDLARGEVVLGDPVPEGGTPSGNAEVPDLGADLEADIEAGGDEAVEEPAESQPVIEDAGEPAPQDESPGEEEAILEAVEDMINAGAEDALDDAAVAMPLEEVIDTPMQILKVAEQAVSEGRAANAKVLLLQAAASIAESEAAEAQHSLDEVTARIQQESSAIEEAKAAVSEAEAQVAEAEQAVAAVAEAVEAGRARVTEHNERVDEVQARIDEIDEEIRKLQARREEEVAALENTREELTAAESESAAIEAEVAQKQEAEAAVRQQLEEARARVKLHQRKRQEYESALDKANDEVRKRSESLTELQQTMARFGLIEPNEAHDSGDLFGTGENG